MRLKQWVSGVAIGVVMCGIGLPRQAVMALSGSEYPYASMPCVHAPFAAQGRGAWCKNYDWGQRHNDTSRGSVISPYGYYYRNCTDYAAWRLATLGVGAQQYQGLGDAKRWAQPAARHALRVDERPAVYAVGVRTTGQYGHVAVVEAVDVAGYPAGSIKVSEYNKRADGTYGERIGTPAQLGFSAFVHFEDYVPAPVPVPAPAPAVVPAVPPAPVAQPVAPSVVPPAAPLPADVSTPPTAAAPLPAPADSSSPAALPQPIATPDDHVVPTPSQPAASAPAPVTAAGEVPPPAIPPVADTAVAAVAHPSDASHTELAAVATVPGGETQVPDQAGPAGPNESHPAPLPPTVSADRSTVLSFATATSPVPYRWWRKAVSSPPLAAITSKPVGSRTPLAHYAAYGLAATLLLIALARMVQRRRLASRLQR